ncbi:hypothetical protein [Arthrobacter sp. UYCu712]|uniref:hypothetical protein n=1 Tax=Arthrobacter sp. UYCu712 TaxID=3156340 RepID=UPI003395F09E
MAGSKSRAGTRYTPGSWIGVIRSGTVVLLRPDAAPGLVESLWELLATGPEVHEVLDAVTSASGGSLTRLPWFGIVDVRDAMQVFLRGEIDLEVRHDGGDVALSGRDVTTWTERRFTAPERFSLSIPGATGGAAATGPAPELPLADGVVLLQGLSANFAGQSAPAKSAEVPSAEWQSTGVQSVPAAAADPAVEEEVLAAAEADIAADDAAGRGDDDPAELGDDDVSAETMVELPEDLDDAGAGTESAPEAPRSGPELTGNYDHLWEQTVMRSIEDAAVREDPDADPEPATGSSTPKEARDDADAPAPGEAPEPAPDEAPAAAPAAPSPVAPASGLIDSVPWHTGGDGQSAARPAPAPVPAPAPQRGMPLPPSFSRRPDTVPAPALPAEPDANHDGQTIIKGDLAAQPTRPARTGNSGAGTAADPGTGPMVLARVDDRQWGTAPRESFRPS